MDDKIQYVELAKKSDPYAISHCFEVTCHLLFGRKMFKDEKPDDLFLYQDEEPVRKIHRGVADRIPILYLINVVF